jgi:hypothetical protein
VLDDVGQLYQRGRAGVIALVVVGAVALAVAGAGAVLDAAAPDLFAW